jgi:hypothetical protein
MDGNCHYAVLMLVRSSIDAAASDRDVIINDLSDIRERLKEQRDMAAAGLRVGT